MILKKTDKSVDDFWQEYEKQLGEKVIARSLGRYISGWEEFDNDGLTNLWGLIIVTRAGFRFHHFPQHHWMDMFNRNREAAKEKIFSIPKDKIVSAELIKETNWLKKIFQPPAPHFTVNYLDESENKKKLLLEADLVHGDLVEGLNA